MIATEASHLHTRGGTLPLAQQFCIGGHGLRESLCQPHHVRSQLLGAANAHRLRVQACCRHTFRVRRCGRELHAGGLHSDPRLRQCAETYGCATGGEVV